MFVSGLHPLDIVRCEETPGMKPKVVEVVRPSGYKTIGVIFREEASEDECVDALFALSKKGVTFEKAASLHFFLAIPPNVSYPEIISFLDQEGEQGVLDYEELD